MSDSAARFLSLAFASSELLFEIDQDGKIVLAMGATGALLGLTEAETKGLHWSDLFVGDSTALAGALIEGLDPAGRRGPVRVELRPLPGRALRRYAAFSICRLPQIAPNISCALSLGSVMHQSMDTRGPHGLHNHDDFMIASQRLMTSDPGVDLDVAFVEFTGLTQAAKAGKTGAEMVSRVAAALRAESFSGETAGIMGDDRFALVRRKSESASQMMTRLTEAAVRAGAPVQATGVSMPMSPSPAGQSVLALRFALEAFIKEGAAEAEAAFGSILAETQAKATAFTRTVEDKRFRLVYQPIVALESGALHHYEVLCRLGDGEASPYETIRMAEELDLIHELDAAVADQAMKKLASPGQNRLHLAVNLSARSLLRPGFVEVLIDRARQTGCGPRLIIEVTESSAMDDLQAANARIQALRSAGHPVCLDDFGAGAAALSYLQALSVDTVKIDGQYIRGIEGPGKSDTVVRHLAKLCRELGVSTVAEMVETDAAAGVLKTCGIDYAQGFHFGRPTAEPVYAPVRAAVSRPVARRVGARESWG